MPSLSSVFGSSRASSARASKESLKAVDEHDQLRESLRGVAFLMNDDVEHAEEELQKGDSAFHKVYYQQERMLSCVD